MTVEGSCLCRGVRFRVTGPFIRAGYCHCSRCRKHSGSSASVQGRVRRDDFQLLQGAELVEIYAEQGFDSKAFCRRCGSSLFGGTWPDGEQVSIRFGALDGDPGLRPQYHTYVASKAPWETIQDELPQHDEALPNDRDAPVEKPGQAASMMARASQAPDTATNHGGRFS